MKRILLLFSALMLSCIALWAHDVEIDGIYYYLDEDDNTATVTCRGDNYYDYDDEYSGSVTIPETITYNSQTYSVTSIGYSAFSGCSGLTEVTIPNSVTYIGKEAFYNTGIYNNNSNWDNGVLYIDNCLIEAKSDVVKGSYTIKEGTRIIGYAAFYGCSGLTSVSIGESVTSIGDEAFYNCSGLTPVTIPNSVTYIGSYAFYNTGIYNNNSNWDNGVLYIDNCLIDAKSDIVKGSYTIKEGTRIIGSSAFRYCSGLTSVTIPNSVTSIGYEAFYDCSGLTKVNYLGTIDKWVEFDWGYGISSPTNYAKDLYINNELLTDVKITTAESIKGCALLNCKSIKSVKIGNSVTSIGRMAFDDCSGLTSVTIGESVTSIGDWAFSGCSGLTSVTIPNSVTSIGSSAFSYCSGLTSVTIPNSVTYIGQYAFEDCSGLTSVTIGESVTSIGERAFYGCDKLRKVTAYPTTVPNVYENSFAHYNAYLYVPCDVFEDYDLDDVFGNYKYIKCIAAEEVDAPDKVEIEVDEDNNANVIWPSIDGAKSYELEITKNGNVFCTLLFNENGQLTSIDFGNRSASVGFQFTVTGLDGASKYAYYMVAMDKKGNELQSYKGTFTTNGYVPGPGEEDEPVSITETLADANITVSGGTISADADFSIYNTIGQDVTAFNGSLQPGVYLVSIENDIVKVMVK